eukprot:354489-Chlamydomonas_euryale.AAC.4
MSRFNVQHGSIKSYPRTEPPKNHAKPCASPFLTLTLPDTSVQRCSRCSCTSPFHSPSLPSCTSAHPPVLASVHTHIRPPALPGAVRRSARQHQERCGAAVVCRVTERARRRQALRCARVVDAAAHGRVRQRRHRYGRAAGGVVAGSGDVAAHVISPMTYLRSAATHLALGRPYPEFGTLTGETGLRNRRNEPASP